MPNKIIPAIAVSSLLILSSFSSDAKSAKEFNGLTPEQIVSIKCKINQNKINSLNKKILRLNDIVLPAIFDKKIQRKKLRIAHNIEIAEMQRDNLLKVASNSGCITLR